MLVLMNHEHIFCFVLFCFVSNIGYVIKHGKIVFIELLFECGLKRFSELLFEYGLKRFPIVCLFVYLFVCFLTVSRLVKHLNIMK